MLPRRTETDFYAQNNKSKGTKIIVSYGLGSVKEAQFMGVTFGIAGALNDFRLNVSARLEYN